MFVKEVVQVEEFFEWHLADLISGKTVWGIINVLHSEKNRVFGQEKHLQFCSSYENIIAQKVEGAKGVKTPDEQDGVFVWPFQRVLQGKLYGVYKISRKPPW